MMKKGITCRRFLALLTVLLTVLLAGCGTPETQTEHPGTGWDSLSPTCLNEFSLRLLRQADDGASNLMLTPWSVAMTAGTVRLAAQGDTAQQLNDLLGCWNVSDDQLAETFRQVNEMFGQTTASMMEDTRAIYVAQGPTVRETYAQTLQQVFGMDVNLVDFSSSVTLELINDWVGRVTEGRVDRIFEELPAAANTLLIDNVICSLSWQKAFDPEATSPQAFTADGGTASVTPMMYDEREVPRYTSTEVDALFLPLSAAGCEVWFLLPPEGTTLTQLIQGLTADQLTAWRAGAETGVQKFFIPTMELSSNMDLLDDLEAMGATALQSEPTDASGTGDLAAMGTGIQLTQLRHRTMLSLSETGSEAAQTVEVGAPYLALQEGDAYVLNRSFAFLVVDQTTGAILLTGAYRTPA